MLITFIYSLGHNYRLSLCTLGSNWLYFIVDSYNIEQAIRSKIPLMSPVMIALPVTKCVRNVSWLMGRLNDTIKSWIKNTSSIEFQTIWCECNVLCPPFPLVTKSIFKCHCLCLTIKGACFFSSELTHVTTLVRYSCTSICQSWFTSNLKKESFNTQSSNSWTTHWMSSGTGKLEGSPRLLPFT